MRKPVLVNLTSHLTLRVPAVADMLMSAMATKCPATVLGVEDSAVASVTSNLHNICRAMLALGEAERFRPELDVAALSWPRELSRLHVEPRIVVDGYQICAEALWLDFLVPNLQELNETESVAFGVLGELASVVFGYVQSTSHQAMLAYSEALRVDEDATRDDRADLVGRVVTGGRVDLTTAGRILQYSFDQHHVCLLIRGGSGAPRGSGVPVESIAAELRQALGLSVLEVSSEGLSLEQNWRLWVALESTDQWSTVRPVIDRLLLRSGWTAAVSEVAPAGVAGFRTAYQQAVAVMHALEASRTRRVGPAFHEDMQLIALAANDIEQARRLARSKLHNLDHTRDADAVLLRTLHSFLRHHRRVGETAADLEIHRNTLLYRLRRLEQLLGRPVSDLGLDTHVAVEVLEWFGA